MSRIGRRPIPLPSGVEVKATGNELQVQGPKGSLSAPVPPSIRVEIEEGVLRFSRADDRRPTRAFHGLARATAANMVKGVTEGFARELIIEGVGYRAELSGNKLTLSLGYSHPIAMQVPAGIQVALDGPNKLRIEGVERQRVGQFAAEIRKLRPPEPYKGKGVRYSDERIRRKAGKAGAAS